MVLSVVITLLAVIVLAVIINGVEDVNRYDKMSFREAMDLTDLPIVTFYQGEERFNFLLDTGSTYSHISSSAAQRLKGEEKELVVSVIAVGGSRGSTSTLATQLVYKNKPYNVILCAGEHMDDAFEAVKKENGVQIHGIIGNDFLSQHNYIIDFEELVAYSKGKK